MEIIQTMGKTPNNQKALGNMNSTIYQINGDYIAMDEGKMTNLGTLRADNSGESTAYAVSS